MGLLTTAAVLLPYYLVTEQQAEVLLTASSIWLVLMAFVVGTFLSLI